MPATLRLTREGFGIELRRGPSVRDARRRQERKLAQIPPDVRSAAPARASRRADTRRAVLEPGPVLRRGRRRNRQLPLSRSYGLAEITRVDRQAGSGDRSQARIAIWCPGGAARRRRHRSPQANETSASLPGPGYESREPCAASKPVARCLTCGFMSSATLPGSTR